MKKYLGVTILAVLLAGCEGSTDDAGGVEGVAGFGAAGMGTAGMGTAGMGTAGMGTAGTGAAGMGTAGTGTAGTGSAGTGSAGTGSAGTGGGGAGNGYYTNGTWKGYAWTAKDSLTTVSTSLSPADFSTHTSGPFCASGSVGSAYEAFAMIGFNVNQDTAANSPTLEWNKGSSGGVAYSVTNSAGSPLRIQIQAADGATNANHRWCASIGASGTIAWNDFNTECWEGGNGAAYDGTPITAAIVMVPGDINGARSFNFCVNSIGPDSGGGTGGTGGTGGAGGSSGASGTGGGSGGMTGTGTITDPFGTARVTNNGNNYIIQNNLWGGSGTQNLSFNGTTFKVTTQTCDNGGSGNPCSYPSVFIGQNNNRETGNDNLPKQVSSIQSVNTKLAWTANGAGGQYNVAYDVWFTNSAAGNINSPDRFLMVWLYDPSQKQPRGNCQWSGVTIPGVPGTWNVWTDGVCISYVATSTVNSLTFDLNAFIKDATSTHTGTISSSMYLHDIFGGFEIWSGGQGLQITDFYAVVK